MHHNSNRENRGFSLVELLAVVLVLAVLAAVAVPLYMNTRKTSAARTCKANVAELVRAEATYNTRFGVWAGDASDTAAWEATYVAVSGGVPTGGLLGAPEGMAEVPLCPLDGRHYSIQKDQPSSGKITIQCQNATTHQGDSGTPDTSAWVHVLSPSGSDTTNGI